MVMRSVSDVLDRVAHANLTQVHNPRCESAPPAHAMRTFSTAYASFTVRKDKGKAPAKQQPQPPGRGQIHGDNAQEARVRKCKDRLRLLQRTATLNNTASCCHVVAAFFTADGLSMGKVWASGAVLHDCK